MGEIILPLTRPATGDESEDRGLRDFTFEAASWSLVVHEGWALYAESEMKPYLPLDGQLVSLQHRLLRAARAFLDPGLQLGEIDREQAMRILTRDVVISDPAERIGLPLPTAS